MNTGGLMVITAHPDDETLIAGGLLAACACAAVPTAVVCLTRGEGGDVADGALLAGRTLGEVREAELRAACAVLAVGWLVCYRRCDGALRWAPRRELSRQLARVIARRRPAAVVTFGEDGLYHHEDHIAVAALTRAALGALQRPPALYESVWPASASVALVAELRRRRLPCGLWGVSAADFGREDERGAITLDLRSFAAVKLAALRCHRTQLSSEHAFSGVPHAVFRRYLGFERFRPVGRSRWLQRTLGSQRALGSRQ